MGQFLARYAARQIAYIEDWQFFMSTGGASGVNGTAEGLVKAVVTDSCFYYNGGSSTSGKTKGSDATLADFRNLRNASGISGVVLNNAKYYMHPTYEALLVSFNTSATVTPYQRGTNGQPATLDGFPIVWVPVMSVYSTSAAVSVVTVLFGDVSYQYMGVRNGIRFDTSRDAAFATDEILVRCVERLTVGLMASKAVAGLRNSAS
jgi:HK97 family phage major capsid protein